jgi:alanyl-tRNA synthetase
VAFLIGDGVLPSNEGRGYVLRRILRRAARHGKLLGMNRPFLHKVCGVVINEMKGAYPDLVDKAAYIRKVVESEETVSSTPLMRERISRRSRSPEGEGASIIPANRLRLYDTFGFPDLTADIVRKDGLPRHGGFEMAMAASGKRRGNPEGAAGGDLRGYHRLSVDGIATEFAGTTRRQAGQFGSDGS